ncbi:MAG: cyclic nucleotide-binding domain-containing protein [Rhodoferax sp.]|nr:cyclic nucleotide-binding domain-containing protein [Rhodoferax sp.]
MQSEEGETSRLAKAFGPGETIFHQGQPGDAMYVVQEGQVDIVASAEQGSTHLSSLNRGKIFGEMALVDRSPRTANAVAGPSGATVLVIDRPQFVYLVSQQPAFALVVLEAVVGRMRSLGSKALNNGVPA